MRPPRRAAPRLPLLAAVPLVVALFAGASLAKDAPTDAIPSAVLRVEVSVARRDWNAPWKLRAPESVSGTSFAIAADRLLTNAHVVRDAQQITVKKSNGSAPAIATVEAADEDCDLAVLRLPDKTFLAGVHPSSSESSLPRGRA